MANPTAERFAEWTRTIPADVAQTFELLTDAAIAPQGRRILAGSLSYFLAQLDIIPDHEPAGAVDDCFVLRAAHGLCAEYSAKAGHDATARVARFTNEEDEVRAFLGEALFAKFRRFVLDAADKPVLGRTPDQILSDASMRAALKRELDAAMKKLKPVVLGGDKEGDAMLVSVKSFFSMKLGG